MIRIGWLFCLVSLLLAALPGEGLSKTEWRREAVKNAIRDEAIIRATNGDGATFIVGCRVLVGVPDWVIGATGPIPERFRQGRSKGQAKILIDVSELRWPQDFLVKRTGDRLNLARQLVIGPYDPPYIRDAMKALSAGSRLRFRFRLTGEEWSWALRGFAAVYAEGGFEACTGG